MTDTVTPTDEDVADIGDMFDQLVGAAPTDADGSPKPVIAGTMALYPDGDGGLVLVADIQPGGMLPPGIHRRRLPAVMLRSLGMLGGGGFLGRMMNRRSRGRR